MKLSQLAVIVGATLVSFCSISSQGLAATITNPQLDFYIPKLSNIVLESCSQRGVCSPDQKIPLNLNVSASISANDSTFNLTNLFLTINPNEGAVWGNGISNIYKNLEISQSGKPTTFNEGLIPVVESLLAGAKTTPANTAVKFSIAIDGTPVPEPDSILGTLAFASIGASLYLRRYLKRQAQYRTHV
ncbi:hypothetical protein [Nostoc sp.]|uniref:hypothetical protein n=1 Tax=Nostoc sp. TaxID=1180 RepID=UPI002FF9A05A